MSTLRVSNIEAKADPSSPSVDEKLKVTNSNGDVLVHIDGKTAGITTVGINTTDRSFTVDAAQNVEFIGIVTATKFSLSGGGEITGGDGNFTGIVTSGSGNFTGGLSVGTAVTAATANFTGGLSVGTAVTAATANFTSSLTASSANFTGNVSIAGTLTYEDVTNVDSIGIATARTGIDVTGGHIDLVDNSKIRVGTGDDLEIYHDGTNSTIDNNTGDLNITTTGSGDDIYLDSADDIYLRVQGNESGVSVIGNGAVELYQDNSKKFETITTGVKVTGALEVTQEYPSIRPTLDLNFAATKTLDRRITFTRDSIGTFTGEDGLIKYASNNVPRFDHDPETGESLGLLIEESRANYVLYSQMLEGWSFGVGTDVFTASSGSQLSANPDGSSPAYHYVPSSSSGHHRHNENVTLPTLNTNYVISLFVKRVTTGSVSNMNRYVELEATGSWAGNSAGSGQSGSTGNSYVVYDLQNLTTHPGQPDNTNGYVGSPKIEAYGNDWYRLSYVFNPGSGSQFTGTIWWGHLQSSAGDAGNETGNGNPSFYFWGASVEKGSFITSYIPTSGSTATRAVDTAQIKGTNFTDWYNETEFTIHFESSIASSTAAKYFTFHGADGGGTELIEGAATSGPGANIFTYANSTTYANISVTDSGATTIKYAAGIKANDINLAVNGTLGTADTSSTQPDALDKLIIGNYISGNYYINTSIKKLSYYNRRLPDAQLQGLTQ